MFVVLLPEMCRYLCIVLLSSLLCFVTRLRSTVIIQCNQLNF